VQTAKERMIAMEGMPDFPEKRLAWFVDLFPESQEHAQLANVPEIRDGTLLAQPPSDTTTR
jgi:hypothetical protein